MLTIVMLLTGDVQEARMVRAYLQENYSGEEYERDLQKYGLSYLSYFMPRTELLARLLRFCGRPVLNRRRFLIQRLQKRSTIRHLSRSLPPFWRRASIRRSFTLINGRS